MSRLTRRRCVAALAGGLLAGAARAERTPDEWMALAEAALKRGDSAGAAMTLTRAAHQVHASEIEQSMVRAWMQAGDYRRALAFAAHTAGAHPDHPAGAVLYAWLLGVGGQTAAAQSTLDVALQHHPDAWLRDVASALRIGSAPAVPWLQAPMRLAPYATGAATPSTARVIGSGCYVDGGRHVLAASGEADVRWVRDGLGRTRVARTLRSDLVLGLALLAVEIDAHDLPAPPRPPADAFPGSPACAVEFAHDRASEQAAWPWLRNGFIGMPVGTSPERQLGIELPDGPRGGPVFDLAGRWLGVHRRVGASDHLVPLGALQPLLSGLELAPPTTAAPRLPPDQLYEGALRWTVQVLVA